MVTVWINRWKTQVSRYSRFIFKQTSSSLNSKNNKNPQTWEYTTRLPNPSKKPRATTPLFQLTIKPFHLFKKQKPAKILFEYFFMIKAVSKLQLYQSISESTDNIGCWTINRSLSTSISQISNSRIEKSSKSIIFLVSLSILIFELNMYAKWNIGRKKYFTKIKIIEFVKLHINSNWFVRK